jgi:glycopeptide antibiotics resistance protein
MPNLFIKTVFLVQAITLPGWILYRLITNVLKQKRISFKAELLPAVFFSYCIMLLTVTLFPLPSTRYINKNTTGINVVPVFTTINEFNSTLQPSRRFMTGHVLTNIIGNIILFIPFGIFIPLLFSSPRSMFRRHRLHPLETIHRPEKIIPPIFSFKNVIIIAFLISSFIELSQLLLREFHVYRSVDIDDIILNIIGASIGYLAYYVIAISLNKNIK